MIEQVRNDPAMPIHWGANQPGMQARTEVNDIDAAKAQWMEAARHAANVAEQMNFIGLHKQVANRILEPFQWMHTIATATEWDNFFKLRLHPDADPNIYELARVMKIAMEESEPVERYKHTPYVNEDSPEAFALSAARSARVSYLNHDGSKPDHVKDLALAESLRASGHASPFEHAAFADDMAYGQSANFRGWQSYRYTMDI
jgi:hypothetical protein